MGKVAVETGDAYADFSTPHALTTSEVPHYVNYFCLAARNAITASFDNVELHGATGMLIDQFLKSSANNRIDYYGGSLSNRIRFLEKNLATVATEIGTHRLGVRISPFVNDVEDASETDPGTSAVHIATTVEKHHPLYLHVVQPHFHFSREEHQKTKDSLWPVRRAFHGPIMAAGGFNRELGDEAVREGRADLVVYGRWFIPNPDLVARFAAHVALNPYDRSTFYTTDPIVGYMDYPLLGRIQGR